MAEQTGSNLKVAIDAALKGKTLEKATVTQHAEVIKHDGAIMVPQNMTYLAAAQMLVDRDAYEQQVITVSRVFDAFPWDGAVALDTVLKLKYGWSPMRPTPSFFGTTPPAAIQVEVAYGEFRSVSWGRFFIPGIEAVLDMGAQSMNGRICFTISGQKVKRMWQPQIDELLLAVAEEIKQHSIYRGKAWTLDISGANMIGDNPSPKLVDTDIDPAQLIFSQSVMDKVETNIFTPLRRYTDLKAAGEKFKRGVLLSGTFGTGKTLAVKVASHYAVESGITFINCPHAADLAQCVEYARLYQPAVVFAEDIDRETGGERTAEMDQILNVVDGIDSKKADVMIVLTSNDVHSINKAMLRKGRLDASINVTPPDAEAVERLIRSYGKGMIPLTESVTRAAEVLAGTIPADIAEAVKRSRLVAIKNSPVGTHKVTVLGEDMAEAAQAVKDELDWLNGRADVPQTTTIDTLITTAVTKGFNGHVQTTDEVHDVANKTHALVKQIRERV
jgi:transitional endoplasmic reticulum ATPase